MNTTELLAAIRRRGRLPDNDPEYTDANLLLEANEQMLETFVPTITGVRSEYYTRSEDQTITADQQAYAIPSRSISSVPRLVYYVDSSGSAYRLPLLPLADLLQFEGQSGRPEAHVIKDDEILLVPKPSTTTGTLRVEYEYRPGTLVTTTAGPACTAINTSSGLVTVTAPAGWSTSNTFDLVKATSPYTLLAADLTASAVSASTSVTFTAADLPSRLAVGDYVCLAGESPVPMLPETAHSVLALVTAAECLQQMGDPGFERVAGHAGRALERVKRTMTPREKGTQQKITSPNSALRRRRRRRWAGAAS